MMSRNGKKPFAQIYPCFGGMARRMPLCLLRTVNAPSTTCKRNGTLQMWRSMLTRIWATRHALKNYRT